MYSIFGGEHSGSKPCCPPLKDFKETITQTVLEFVYANQSVVDIDVQHLTI